VTAAAAPEDPRGQGREWISLDCDQCDAVITGWDRGVGSASWKLGTHRYTKHGIRGSGPAATRKNDPTSDELAGDGTSPVTATVRSMASAAGGRKGKPSADDLAAALGRGAGLTIMAAAVHVVESDPRIPPTAEGDRIKDGLIDRLSLSDRAAKEIMAPFGRIMAPTRLNERYGRAVVDNADAVGSIAELANLVMVWRGYMRDRREQAAAHAAALDQWDNEGGAPAPAAAPWLEAPAAPDAPAAAPDGYATTPAPTAGIILTPAEILRMRGATA
jgi:hypothetical protein